jgi:putative component of toxin-antitoxin plasmid stabilization module
MTSWTAEFYEDSNGKRPVETWMESLSEAEFAALRAAVLHVLEPQGLALGGSAWLKALGQGLHEFRVRHDAATIEAMYSNAGSTTSTPPARILLRMFVHFHGDKVILLLHGYDKGKASSASRQNKEIKEARKRLRDWQQVQRDQRRR